jgi:hypothetical protein
LKQCYETLISVAQECGGHLPYRTNFILDEFANMPPLKDVTTMVTAARSRHIRFSFVIQNFAQLYEVYGKENGETIKGNCGNIIYLISSELSALEEISKLCGEVKSKDKDKTDSRPLVTVSDLQRLPQWTLIAIRIRMMPFKSKLTPNWQMVNNNGWGKNYGLAPYPIREKGIVQTFNIKQFVDKKKEEKVTNMLNNITGGASKPVDTSFNPFANPGQGLMPKMNPGGFDVDEMVRRIDAKIAELEEEEKREKEKMEKEKNEKSSISANVNLPENINEENSIKPLIPDAQIALDNIDTLLSDIIPETTLAPLKDEIPSSAASQNNTNSNYIDKMEEKKEDNNYLSTGEDKNILINSFNDEADEEESSGGKFFGLPIVDSINNISLEKEADAATKEDKVNNFFDFIVPVNQEESYPVSVSEDKMPESKNDIISSIDESSKLPDSNFQQDLPVEREKAEKKQTVENKAAPVVQSDTTKTDLLKKNTDKLETKVINPSYVTDDQFFDDFFNEEE